MALGRAKGVACKQRGSSVVIEGIRYTPKEFTSLPHNLSLEAAAIVQVPEGLVFQGHHAYLSNMYITPAQYKEHTYPSAESAYQCACARFHGDEALALQIQSEKDPYVVKTKSCLDAVVLLTSGATRSYRA